MLWRNPNASGHRLALLFPDDPLMDATAKYFLKFQADWINDESDLILVEKSRQIGMSFSTAYKIVRMTAKRGARLDSWVASRDEAQAKFFLEDCKAWAKLLQIAAEDLGEMVIEKDKDLSAFVLRFANGLCIYSLSSNPDAFAGKRGNVVLDEFALHKDQRQVYKVAKAVTQWGGQLMVISTHRGEGSVFYEFIKSATENGNPMGWSHHKVTIQDAVEQGLAEKINQKKGSNLSREQFLTKIRSECLDEEQWDQEYCCIPSSDATAFIDYQLIVAAQTTNIMKDVEYLRQCGNPLYLAMDIARTTHLSVIGIGEKIGDVLWDRMRLVLLKKTFTEQEDILYPLLGLPNVKRACMDNTGLGMQLVERAKEKFGYKVEPITFSGPVKEALAFPLRAAFEDKKLRIDNDQALRADIRGIKKTVTAANNIRFEGESADGHCDRFWELAMRWHAAGIKTEMGACVA